MSFVWHVSQYSVSNLALLLIHIRGSCRPVGCSLQFYRGCFILSFHIFSLFYTDIPHYSSKGDPSLSHRRFYYFFSLNKTGIMPRCVLLHSIPAWCVSSLSSHASYPEASRSRPAGYDYLRSRLIGGATLPPTACSYLLYRTARRNKGAAFPPWTGCVKKGSN